MTYDGPLEDMNSVQRHKDVARSALPPMANPIISRAASAEIEAPQLLWISNTTSTDSIPNK
jgi:hypothetical protein